MIDLLLILCLSLEIGNLPVVFWIVFYIDLFLKTVRLCYEIFKP